MSRAAAGERCSGAVAGAAEICVRELGRVPYREGLEEQLRRVEAVARGSEPETLLLLEHPPVITCGRGTKEGHIRAGAAELGRRGVEVVEVSRGGDVTYHGPGQLVGYPILDLRRRGRDVGRCLRGIEQALIDGLGEFGVRAGREPGSTGVWIGDAKIAAIGIAVRHWVTYHGFALNVDIDLDGFDLVVPCGLHGRRVTSIRRELGTAPPAAEVRAQVAAAFRRAFAR